MDDFSAQVGRWCDLAGDRARVAFLAIAFAAQQEVKKKTPVDTGYLRANWQIVRGDQVIPVERIPREKALAAKEGGSVTEGVLTAAAAALSGEGAATTAMQTIVDAAEGPMAARRDLSGVQLGDKLHIVNPTSYAREIEFGRQVQRADGGTTQVRPAAMVQRTIAEMPEIAARAIAPFVRGQG